MAEEDRESSPLLRLWNGKLNASSSGSYKSGTRVKRTMGRYVWRQILA